MKVLNHSVLVLAIAAFLNSATARADESAGSAVVNEGATAQTMENSTGTMDAMETRALASKKSKKKKKKNRRKKRYSALPTETKAQDNVAVAAAGNEKAPAATETKPTDANSAPVAAASDPVKADPPAAPVQESTSNTSDYVKKHFAASYIGWLTGPRWSALDGGEEGAPSNTSVDHYFTLGYKFNDKLKLAATQIGSSLMGAKNAEQHFAWHDPYVTLSTKGIVTGKQIGRASCRERV